MTKQEFEQRVKMTVSADEYAAIEVVYLNSDLDKDEFCKMWCKMNGNRVKAAKAEAKAQAKWDALSAAEKAFAFMRKEATKRSEQTGSEYPVSDTEIDLQTINDLGEYEKFTLYFVLRDTGATITFSQKFAQDWYNDFESSNPTIYRLIGCRCLDNLKVEEIA